MKHDLQLTIASLFSLSLLSLHLADDIVRGFEKGGLSNLTAIPIMVLWLYGTLVLAGRRSGYVIVLLGSILGTFVPYVHFRGTGGVTGHGIAASSGALLWVWTLLAIGASSLFSVLLAARGLLSTTSRSQNPSA
jgi:hypothetical protein